MNRKIFLWKLRSAELQLGERTLIMGVLNVTPDSFSDGGRYSDPDRAYARALELEEQGADIIDIGAESTRPHSARISAEEEWQRLVPVLKRLRDKLRVPLSLDTYKSETAERALDYGIEILNDPSGLTFDADLAKVAVNANAGLILNHMRGTPDTWGKLPPLPDVVGSISKDLEATVSRARRAGVEKNRIMIDPGLGFGKRKEQNSDIIAHLARLAVLDYPVLIGPSRKSFLAQPTDGETLYATAAAVAAAILNGAHIVRVHDVKEMRTVVQVADEITRASAAAHRAESEETERAARPRRAPVTMFEEPRAKPPRPPLARPAAELPATKETPEAPHEHRAEAVDAGSERPVRRPPQDRPSKGWTPPPSRRPAGDRPAAGGPPHRRDQPARGGEKQERPSRGPWQDRGARPGVRPQGGAIDKPFRGPRRDAPGRDAPGRDAPERRGDRPPRGRSGDSRPGDSRPGGSRPGERGPRDFRPRSDRGQDSRPDSGRPQRGPSDRGPKGGPPRRPFRKRP